MPNYRKDNPMRVLRKAEQREPVEATEHLTGAIEILAGLGPVVGIGLYIGTVNTSGGVKVRLYGGDGNAETYIGRLDDAVEVIGEALEAIGHKGLIPTLRREAAARTLPKPPRPAESGRTIESLPPIGSEADDPSEPRSKRRT